MAGRELTIPLRITLHHVPPGVRFALQKGKADAKGNAELVAPTHATSESLKFDFSVRIAGEKSGNRPRFLGPFTQGPPEKRFVYVNSGMRAGQQETFWDRRAKIPLTTITCALIEKVRAERETLLEIEIEGTGKDGGPVCASLLSSTVWRTARK